MPRKDKNKDEEEKDKKKNDGGRAREGHLDER